MFSSFSRTLFLWAFVTIFFSGCATTAQQPTPPETSGLSPEVLHRQHLDQLATIESFSLKGRLGVIKNTKPKSVSARLMWQHAAQKDNIDVYSPLSTKVANIINTPEQITYTDSKQTITAKDVESLTQKTLGFALPLASLTDWAVGQPSDDSLVEEMSWDAFGRITTLKQNGWHIQYKDYQNTEGYFLPKKVFLKTPGLSIKLVIDKWFTIQ